MKRWFPWIPAALFALWFGMGAQAPATVRGFDVAGFGRLPVLLNGRIQPLDSVARNALLSISGKSIVRVEGGSTLTASEWLLETMTAPELANQRRIFRVQHPDLQGLLGGEKSGLATYSFNDLTNQIDAIETQARKIFDAERDKGDDAAKTRTAFQKDVMHLYESLVLYHRCLNSLEPDDTPNFSEELTNYQQAIIASRAAFQKKPQATAASSAEMQAVSGFYQRYGELSALAYPLLAPPDGRETHQWSNMGTNLLASMGTGEISEPAQNFAAMAVAFRGNQPADFNKALARERVWMQQNGLNAELAKGGREYLFNQMEPFYRSMVIYVAALMLGCIFWLNMSEWVRRTGFALLGLAFVIHTFGLGFRMYLEGRPPVTNLYSSAIFIGWGAVLLGLILEKIFKGAIGLVSSALVGFTTLIIAHHLAMSGDTMEMLRAVLDTNLWLATHVVVITIGYSSMFLAGLLAVIYIVRGYFTNSLTPETARSLGRMVYGIVCFATLASFVGTILGGIWADQSWGRFWGWDPKENGALLIVLWNAIVLHARWGGLIRERGLMAMAVFGNIVTSFSWFGVNMLGVGLHSYGFMDQAFQWLMAFDISQALIIVLAFAPRLPFLRSPARAASATNRA